MPQAPSHGIPKARNSDPAIACTNAAAAVSNPTPKAQQHQAIHQTALLSLRFLLGHSPMQIDQYGARPQPAPQIDSRAIQPIGA